MDTLQEFIVRIKYVEDSASRNNMISGIKGIAGELTKISAIGLGAATLIAKGTLSIAEGINSIYNTSRLLSNSTVQSLRAITEAAADVGDSVEGMTGSLSNLNKFIKMSGPGALNFLQTLTGSPIKPGTATTDIMSAIAKNIPNLKEQGMTPEYFYNAVTTAGVSFESAQAMWEQNAEFLKQQEKHSNAFGTSTDKTLAPDIHGQMNQLTVDFSKGLGILSETFGQSLKNVIDGELKIFEGVLKGLDNNQEGIKTIADEITEKMDEFGGTLGTMLGQFSLANTTLDALKEIFRTMQDLTKSLITSIDKLGDPLSLIKDGIDFLAGATVAANGLKGLSFFNKGGIPKDANLMSAFPWIRAAMVGIGAYEMTSAINGGLGNPAGDLGNVTYNMTHDEYGENIASKGATALARWGNKDSSDKAVHERERMSYDYLRSTGLSNIDASAIMGSLAQETSGFDPFAQGDKDDKGNYQAYGIEQWHKDRQDMYKSVFGHSMQSVIEQKQALMEQLQFIDWERNHTEKRNWEKFQNTANDPYHRAGGYSENIVRPKNTTQENDVRGQYALGYAQQFGDVHITINGDKYPQETAKAVKSALEDQTRQGQRYNTMTYQ